MKKVIKSDLKKIYQEEMKKCSDAVKDGKHPYHIFTFSSIKDKKWPEIRIVVLRDFKFNPNVIYFNTDYRSPKIAQMKNNNNCCALFYDGIGKVQIRFHAKASIHYQDSIAYEIWKKTALQSRKCYMGEMNPSSEIQEWHPNFPITYLKKDPKLEHSEEGFQNFTCIKLNVIETEILKLYHDGHVRFNIKNKILNFIAP
ncbi:MAG: pyridoxamine 5'-phosphate oxidase family protein [Candidatus Neomarinimicrobiota bacterium]|nr:pyridoxamine 5'-phosphate oxidase family protein [Candidatus Neomarinimicrobiota bacterium]